MENTHEQQLNLISEMIQTAQKEFNDKSFIYLLWGWAVCLASLAQFGLMKINYSNSGIIWAIIIPLAMILQVVFMLRQKKTERVRTHMDRIVGYVWIAFGASMTVVLVSGDVMQLSTFPVLILLYGIGTFISGGIMKLKPMMMGGICCWVIGLAAFHVTFDYQLLLLSLSLLLAYIIPGHILHKRYSKHV